MEGGLAPFSEWKRIRKKFISSRGGVRRWGGEKGKKRREGRGCAVCDVLGVGVVVVGGVILSYFSFMNI